MSRTRFAGIAMAVCLVLTAGQPAALDLVRYPAAMVLSWPARALTDWLRSAPRTGSELDESSRELGDLWRRSAAGSDAERGFRVFAVSKERHSIFIEGGINQGLRRGDVVHDAEHLLGFIDLVTERASRVRLTLSPSSHVAGRIELPEGLVLPPTSSPDLLLSGRGEAGLVARQGCRIHKAFTGLSVRYLDDSGLWSLQIGTIAMDEELAQPVVKPSYRMGDIDRVMIGAGSARPDSSAGSGVLSARIMSSGRVSASGRTWLLSKGARDGVRPGAWVSCGGALVGQVARVGFFTARMRAFPDLSDDVAAVVARSDDEWARFVTWQDAEPGERLPGHHFTRGRGPLNGLPPGLWLGTVDDEGTVSRPLLPVTGEAVTIHEALPQRTVFRLGLSR